MKAYYNQQKISSSFINFFSNIFSLSKPLLKNLAFIITGMISAESVVTSDFSRKLKDNFSSISIDSMERRFRRFFASFSSYAYSSFELLIKHIISNFSLVHSNKVVISLDHMLCKDKFTILLFSLRIGKQGIPIWFRCFKGFNSSDAYSLTLINQGISFCSSLFPSSRFHVVFLADRWFTFPDILSHIQKLRLFLLLSR